MDTIAKRRNSIPILKYNNNNGGIFLLKVEKIPDIITNNINIKSLNADNTGNTTPIAIAIRTMRNNIIEKRKRYM